MAAPLIPHTSAALAANAGPASVEWYNYWRRSGEQLRSATAIRIWRPEDFGAKGNAILVESSSVTIEAGDNNLQVTGANFAPGVAGQVITIEGAGTAGAYHTTTIATWLDATNVTITDPAATALATAAKDVIYGTDDSGAFERAAEAMRVGTVQFFAHTAGKKYIVLPSLTAFRTLMDLEGVEGLYYDGAKAEVIVPYTDAFSSSFFRVVDALGITIVNFKGTQVRGLLGGMNWMSGSGQCADVHFRGVDCDGGDSVQDFNRDYNDVARANDFSQRVSLTGTARNIYYPAQNRSAVNGWYVDIDCENAGREFIFYGTEGPNRILCRSKDPVAQWAVGAYGHNTDTAIKRTANACITYINNDSTTTFGNGFVFHEQADPSVDSIATVLENIHIHVDVTFPASPANGAVLANASYIGHSGTQTLGNCAHVERNMRLSGTIRGRNANAPIIAISTAAKGWGNLGVTEWSLEHLNITDETTNAIAIGQYPRVTGFKINAPNLPHPVFDGSPDPAISSWYDCLFATQPFGVIKGVGAPTLSAKKGTLYLRSDGSGTNDRLYVNTNGTTGWTNVVTAT